MRNARKRSERSSRFVPSQQKSGEGLRRRVGALENEAEGGRPREELALDLSRLTDQELDSISDGPPDEETRIKNMLALVERAEEIDARDRVEPAASPTTALPRRWNDEQ